MENVVKIRLNMVINLSLFLFILQEYIPNFESIDDDLSDTVEKLFEFVKEAKNLNSEGILHQQEPNKETLAEISLLKSELESSRSQNAELQKQESDFSEKMEKISSENSYLKECIQKLECDLEIKDKEYNSLTERNKAVNDEISNFGCERENMILHSEELSEKLHSLENNHKELMAKHLALQSDLNENKEQYEIQISVINAKHKEAEEQLLSSKEKFQTKLNEVLEENQNLTKEMENLKKQAADLHVKVVKTETEKIDMQQELDQVMSENTKSNDMRITLQSVIDSLQVDKDHLIEEKKLLQLAEQDFKDSLQEKEETIENLKKEFSESQESISSELNLVKEELSAAHFQLSAQQLQHQKSVEVF